MQERIATIASISRSLKKLSNTSSVTTSSEVLIAQAALPEFQSFNEVGLLNCRTFERFG